MSEASELTGDDRRRPREIALITQMRAGTHFLCYALRVALNATLYRPNREQRYILMDDDYIVRGLHDEIKLPAAQPDCLVYFNHYYHPQQHTVPDVPRIYLIGFPYDSFYSDGVVYSKDSYDVGPSGPRAGSYVMRAESSEWKFLEEKMTENAEWLEQIKESDDAIIFRYEDFFLDFEKCAERLSRFVGGFNQPLPKPIKNPKRMYWTEAYSSCFDAPALDELFRIFGPATERFYPERMVGLRAAATQFASGQ
jgi:hypothetical protein